LIADFLSPVIANQHHTDPSISTFTINTKDDNHRCSDKRLFTRTEIFPVVLVDIRVDAGVSFQFDQKVARTSGSLTMKSGQRFLC
jgi:hypothetical protein